MKGHGTLEAVPDELSAADILRFLQTDDPAVIAHLYRTADRIRAEYVGDEIHIRALLNISNYCIRNCCYCGLRRDNRELVRYRMTADEIVAAARRAAAQGYRTIVLQSGEDPFFTEEIVCDIIAQIRSSCDIVITLSLGERNYQTLMRWFQEGARRYLLKYETSDPTLYQAIHPDMQFQDRIRMLENLKEIGYQTGTGIIVGLPGQTYASVADDILLFHKFDADMIACGPFIYNPKTPLCQTTPDRQRYIQPDAVSVYKVIALARIMTRDTLIPATTALRMITPRDGVRMAFQAGANVIMHNVTPQPYAALYEIYPQQAGVDQFPTREAFVSFLESATGRTVSHGYGDRRAVVEGKRRHPERQHVARP
ncbi:MAG: [FeFe] hydrogenase H-cluster radical SAM maturase HydE [Desulfobacterota bacterium]|nr:[FeFe] hydrogenase H-cluster radical SAM maturase HydE [Thermodesulfobacteriota bacterium]